MHPPHRTLSCTYCPPVVYPAPRSPSSTSTVWRPSAAFFEPATLALFHSTGAPQFARTSRDVRGARGAETLARERREEENGELVNRR